jgi:hypothetical protein
MQLLAALCRLYAPIEQLKDVKMQLRTEQEKRYINQEQLRAFMQHILISILQVKARNNCFN